MTASTAVDSWVVMADGCSWLAPASEPDHRADHEDYKRGKVEHVAKCSDPSCEFAFFHAPDVGRDDGPYSIDGPATLAANPGMRPAEYLDDAELAAWAEADPAGFQAARVVVEAEAIAVEAAAVPGRRFQR